MVADKESHRIQHQHQRRSANGGIRYRVIKKALPPYHMGTKQVGLYGIKQRQFQIR